MLSAAPRSVLSSLPGNYPGKIAMTLMFFIQLLDTIRHFLNQLEGREASRQKPRLTYFDQVEEKVVEKSQNKKKLRHFLKISILAMIRAAVRKYYIMRLRSITCITYNGTGFVRSQVHVH